jgi:hypothetical protein
MVFEQVESWITLRSMNAFDYLHHCFEDLLTKFDRYRVTTLGQSTRFAQNMRQTAQPLRIGAILTIPIAHQPTAKPFQAGCNHIPVAPTNQVERHRDCLQNPQQLELTIFFSTCFIRMQ